MLFRLLMTCMLPAGVAVLFQFKPVGGLLFVLCRRVIPPLAFPAGQYNKLPHCNSPLFNYLGDDAGTDRLAALADGKPQFLFKCDGCYELDGQGHVVAGHDHLDAVGKLRHAGHVGGPQVELWTVAGEERRVAAALFLRQDVDLALELRVRGDGPGLCDDLAALNLVLLRAAKEKAHVVASHTGVEDLSEHLDGGGDGLLGGTEADDLDLVAGLHDAPFYPSRYNCAAAGDREDVLDGHQEGLVGVAGRLRYVGVDRFHELVDALALRAVRLAAAVLERFQCRSLDDGDLVAWELVLGKKLTELHLYELDELGVVDHVGLIEVDDDGGDADLTGEQYVLTGLGHGAVIGAHDQDGAVHLGGPRDHVLDVVGMARAVDVGVVAPVRLVLDVGGGDRDAPFLLLGSLVYLVERDPVGHALLREAPGDGARQGGLPVIYMADGSYVHMWFRPFKLFLTHTGPP